MFDNKSFGIPLTRDIVQRLEAGAIGIAHIPGANELS